MTSFLPTVTSLDEAVLAAEYSQANVEYCGVTCTPSGYFYAAGKRIGLAKAETMVAQAVAEDAAAAEAMAATEPPADHRVDPAAEPRQPKRTGFTWDALNQATKQLFFRLDREIRQTAIELPRLGLDIHIALVDAPRLTNLKKAGLLETVNVSGTPKSWRHLRLTQAGQDLLAQIDAYEIPA